MPLQQGFTRFHGIVLDAITARQFRNMEKRLRNRIDCGHYRIAQQILAEIKCSAGEHQTLRQVFEAIRIDASTRWQRTWGEFPDVQEKSRP